MKSPKVSHVSKGNKPWLVMVPAKLSGTGRRAWRYFATKAEGVIFAGQLAQRAAECGTLAALSPAQQAEAAAAYRLLDASGMTLLQAVNLALGTQSGTSTLPVDEGAGERATAGESLAALLAAYDAQNCHQAARTRAGRRTIMGTLFSRNPGLADTPAANLSAADITHCLSVAWPSAPTQYNTALKHLSAAYKNGVRKGVLSADPTSAIDPQHHAEEEVRALTPAELAALFRACRQALPEEITERGRSYAARIQHADTSTLTAYVAIGAFAGIRPEEISRLRWADVDFEDAVISVRKGNSKTGGARHVELHPTLAAWLLACKPAGAEPDAPIIPPENLTAKKKALRLRAGFNAENPWPADALRHSYATYHLKAFGNLQRLQLNMGHRDAHLLYTRYTNMAGVNRQTAAQWWSLTPQSAQAHSN